MWLTNIAWNDFFFSLIKFTEHLLCFRHSVRFWKYTAVSMTFIWKKQTDFSSMELQFDKINPVPQKTTEA